VDGTFIVFEGVDGCGKGTQLKMLASHLFDVDKKNVVLLTREPTGFSGAGRELRRRLLTDKNPRENAELYTQLFVDDRKEHMENIVIPALHLGKLILCDRHKYSTIVYQQTQGIAKDTLIQMHEGMPKPKVVFVIDVPAEVALGRIKNQIELFEKIDFMNELRQGYLRLKEMMPDENIIVIDGNRPVEEVHKQILKEIEKIV
jgi:dTMP kinase